MIFRQSTFPVLGIAALLAACGESQPPIGAPGAVPQSRAIAHPSSPPTQISLPNGLRQEHRRGSADYRLLFSFGDPSGTCPDGAWPFATLIATGGILYGTTLAGGNYDDGTLFSITTSGVEQVLYSFHDLVYSGGDAGPISGVTAVKGNFYGTTYDGGFYHGGTAYEIDGMGSKPVERVLHSFGYGKDGRRPENTLIAIGRMLYGTTSAGGMYSDGTVFRIDRKGGRETVLHDFTGTDGKNPLSALIAVSGKLFGTTAAGGAYGGGTVFSMRLDGSEEHVLHSFGQSGDGSDPQGGLIDINGTLYGTASSGGAYGANGGTVFSVTAAGANERTLHSFGYNTDGRSPQPPVINVAGTLYGTTEYGGANGGGTIFSLNIGSGTEEVLHSFGQGSDGAYPLGGLLNVNGTLYGTTVWGGAYYEPCIGYGEQAGTVYSLTL